ncbi:MAG: glycosyltransferase family 1 protein [Planctomycetota bacterium]|nr:glycosyltransferase family 1 protein [Planctomycetota bacterium]
MRLAFDARCENGKASSSTRVLELWRHAADVVDLEYINWHEGFCNADVLLSPNSDVAPIKGPVKVAALHDVNPLQPQPSSWLRRAPAIHVLKKAARNLQLNADYVITGTNFAKQSIGQAFPALGDKLHVIPHYPSPIFTPGEIDYDLLGQHSLPESCVLFVSALHKQKNWDGMLAAWSALPSELRLNHPLVFVDSNKKAPRKITSGNLIFTGSIDDQVLLNLYRSAKLMVFPSFAEGFGLPPLEALCSGCPVIASDATSIPEVLGNSIDYFNPFEISSIITTLEKHVALPRPVIDYKSIWSAELTGSKLLNLINNI